MLLNKIKNAIQLIFLFVISFAVFPLVSFAHVKWFAEERQAVPLYSWNDDVVLWWSGITLLLIALGVLLEKRLTLLPKFIRVVEKYKNPILSIVSMGYGLAFIIFSINGFIFAPNLHAEGTLGLAMITLQTILGLMMLTGFYERIGGILLLVLFSVGVSVYGLVEMLDTLEMVGFAIYAILMGRPKWYIADSSLLERWARSIKEYSVPILRVGTGINLIILGLSEKILNPALAHDFLMNYHWNFMQKIGFDGFSNYHFIFSAGMVEILFGIFFVLGLITRITTLTLAVFLIATLVLLGPVELVGHLPHFSIALVLLLLGSGNKLKVV